MLIILDSIRSSIVLHTALLAVLLSVAAFPVVGPGIDTAVQSPVEMVNNLICFVDVLCVYAAAFTSESVSGALCSSMSFLIVILYLNDFVHLEH